MTVLPGSGMDDRWGQWSPKGRDVEIHPEVRGSSGSDVGGFGRIPVTRGLEEDVHGAVVIVGKGSGGFAVPRRVAVGSR